MASAEVPMNWMFVGVQKLDAANAVDVETDCENPEPDWIGGVYEPNVWLGTVTRPTKNNATATTNTPIPINVLFMLDDHPISVI